MKENIEPINIYDYFLDENGNILDTKIDDTGISHIPNPKSKKQWYNTTSVRDYITGNSDELIFGRGARSLNRAAKDYQHLSEDFSRHVYSPKFMARKYDKFGGIDLDLIDLSRENAEKEYNSTKTKFESGKLSEKEFNKITGKYQRTLNNLNENYKSLYEVWHGKNDIPLVRTQSSVSSAPFMLGMFGLPAAIIGGISGGVAAAPYIGKFLANPWVQRGLTGLDVVDTGVQAASGNYLGAAANWIPYDKISDIFRKVRKTSHLIKGSRLGAKLYQTPLTDLANISTYHFGPKFIGDPSMNSGANVGFHTSDIPVTDIVRGDNNLLYNVDISVDPSRIMKIKDVSFFTPQTIAQEMPKEIATKILDADYALQKKYSTLQDYFLGRSGYEWVNNAINLKRNETTNAILRNSGIDVLQYKNTFENPGLSGYSYSILNPKIMNVSKTIPVPEFNKTINEPIINFDELIIK